MKESVVMYGRVEKQAKHETILCANGNAGKTKTTAWAAYFFSFFFFNDLGQPGGNLSSIRTHPASGLQHVLHHFSIEIKDMIVHQKKLWSRFWFHKIIQFFLQLNFIM